MRDDGLKKYDFDEYHIVNPKNWLYPPELCDDEMLKSYWEETKNDAEEVLKEQAKRKSVKSKNRKSRIIKYPEFIGMKCFDPLNLEYVDINEFLNKNKNNFITKLEGTNQWTAGNINNFKLYKRIVYECICKGPDKYGKDYCNKDIKPSHMYKAGKDYKKKPEYVNLLSTGGIMYLIKFTGTFLDKKSKKVNKQVYVLRHTNNINIISKEVIKTRNHDLISVEHCLNNNKKVYELINV